MLQLIRLTVTLESGFVLTRQARDINGKSHIELWLATHQGPTQLIIEGEQAVFFIELSQIQACQAIATQQQITVDIRPLQLKDFNQQPLAGCYFASHHQASQLAQALQHADIMTLEADIKLADRYLMERFIQGSLEFTGAITHYDNYRQVRQAKCRQTDYLPQLHVVSLDIECSEKGLLYSIGLHSPIDSRVIMVGQPQPAETTIQWVADEYHLLSALVDWFQRYDPDVIIGWNVYLNLHI